MADCMEFPKRIEEFLDDYSFKDKEEVYTNGSILIPLFRVKQGLEHYMRESKAALEKQIPKKVILGYDKQDFISCPNCNSDIAPMDDLDDCLLYHCPRCGEKDAILQGDNYCFNCGQALDWSDIANDR